MIQYDVIGDIHGCFTEFKQLTNKLGYNWESGVPLHPEGRKLVFLGDLTDRGPNSIDVLEVVWRLVIAEKIALYTPGNHCDKLYRFFKGNKVQLKHGLETTAAEFSQLPPDVKKTVSAHFMALFEAAPLYLQLANGKLIVAHAGIRKDLIGKSGNKVKTFVLYGDITGKSNPDGTPIRKDWAKHYDGGPFIVYGHTPVKAPRAINQTINIDTGAVFGGALTAFRYPEMETVSVPSTMPLVPEKLTVFD